MKRHSDLSNLEIIFNILKCLVAFYSIYFVVASICFGVFRIPESFDGTMPFDFKNWIEFTKCCMSYNKKQIANLVSMELSYFLTTWAFVFMVPLRLWDFAATITLIHVLLSSTVMLTPPLNWNWWICLGIGLFMMISIGEMARYMRKKANEEQPQDTTAANG